MIALALLGAILVFAASMTGRGPDLRWREWHHAYLGWFLTVLGFAVRWPLMVRVGLAISLDDSVQHALQNVPGWGAKRLSLMALAWYATGGKLQIAERVGRWLDKRAE